MKDVSFLTSNGVNVEKSLELFGDMETYNTTLEDFYTEMSPRLSKIKQFKETSDMANYAIEVHALKSDSKYFGFDTLAELAYNHEMESKKNNMFYVVDHYNELITEANRIYKIVAEYLGHEVQVEESTNTENVQVHDKTILVADDSNVTRNFVSKIFADTYNVVVAHDGEDAIRIVSSDRNIVAVLLDLNMPGIGGYGVLDYFKTNNLFSKIPVSIITSDDTADTRNRVFSYGIVDILVKPFNERDIKQVLDKTIYFNDQL